VIEWLFARARARGEAKNAAALGRSYNGVELVEAGNLSQALARVFD